MLIIYNVLIHLRIINIYLIVIPCCWFVYRVGGLEKKDVILIVDDDLDFLESISEVLKENGYRIDTARTGAEALEKTKEEFYALILIDIKLPDMEGIDFLRQIRETDPEMRKIIVTGYPSIENAKDALNFGAHAYLIKPLEIEDLLGTIGEQLEKLNEEFKEMYTTFRIG